MNHSPADIVAQYLHNEEVVVLPPTEGDWQCYVNRAADLGENNTVAITDTQGLKDGRQMRSGETYFHPGIQVRVRAGTESEGWQKMEAIKAKFDAANQESVTIGDNTYTIHSITLKSNIIPLGQDKGTQRRSFTLNAILAVA